MAPSKPPADWTNEFFKHLIEQSNRDDWPPRGSGYWSDFRKALHRVGCSWAQAEEALSIVCDRPKLYPGDWRPAIVEEVAKIKARDVAAGLLGDGTTRADIERASRDCPECGGCGSSARFVHRADHPARRRGERVMGYCGSCDLGRFFAGANKRPTWAETPDMAFRPDLPQLHHPDHWDAETGRPRESEFNREFARLVEENRAGKLSGGFGAALRRLLAGKLASRAESGSVRPPEPSPTASPPGPVARFPKSWRRDPASPIAGPPSARVARPAEEPPSHHEPTPG